MTNTHPTARIAHDARDEAVALGYDHDHEGLAAIVDSAIEHARIVDALMASDAHDDQVAAVAHADAVVAWRDAARAFVTALSREVGAFAADQPR